MSRAKIGGLVALVVGLLTAVAYFVVTSRLESQIRRDVEVRVFKAQQLLVRNAQLEALDIIARAEAFARDPRILTALEDPDRQTRQNSADAAIRDFIANLKENAPRPAFLAVINKEGFVTLMDVPVVQSENWRERYAAVGWALEKRQVSKDVWRHPRGVMKVGVAPVLLSSNDTQSHGAVVVAYALDSKEARAQAELLDAEVAYFLDDQIGARSFRHGEVEKSAEGLAADLRRALVDKGLKQAALEGKTRVTSISIEGVEYVASSAPLPLNYSNKTSGAMVMMSMDRALAPVGAVKVAIVLLGLGALLVVFLAMYVTARFILHPAEEIEQGVGEIINGNVDYVFQPAGADFDGLANALNVMLARLLNRPEPGDEDEEGDRPSASSVLLEEGTNPGQTTPSDPEAVALAEEPEADYYARLFSEFTEAMKKAGEKTDGLNFEGFMGKLRMNEGNLRKKYSCRAVRFRVQIKDGKVTLKPVPIF